MFDRIARGGAIAALLATPFLAGCRPTLSQILKDNGYCELRPPSRLVPPGTIVRMRRTDPLVVDIVCTARESLGEGFQPLSSPSAEIAERLRRGGAFRLRAGDLPALRGSASAELVESVDLAFLDVTVLSLSDASVLREIERREEPCLRAVAAARDAGAELALVREVIQATVLYTIELRAASSLDAPARLAAIQGLAAALGADASTATERTVKGEALFWGAVEDRRWMDASAPPGGPPVRLVGPVPMSVDGASRAP